MQTNLHCLVSGVLLVAILAGCAVLRPLGTYRPRDTPDIVIMGFSGRCSVYSWCSAPAENRAYLSDPTSDTLGAVASAFEAQGLSTQTYSYRAHLYDRPDYGKGYLSADTDLEYIQDHWVRDFVNPTSIVLLAHSHGAQFMSLLAFDHPEATFDFAIYLDAVCTDWDANHLGRTLPFGVSNPFAEVYFTQPFYPVPLNRLGYACDSYPVPGLSSKQDISDVVPDNISYALEVSSTDIPFDKDENHRNDGRSGTAAGLFHIRAAGEGHGAVTSPDSAALATVLTTIRSLGFSAAERF